MWAKNRILSGIITGVLLLPTLAYASKCIEQGGVVQDGKCYCRKGVGFGVEAIVPNFDEKKCPGLFGVELTLSNPDIVEKTKTVSKASAPARAKLYDRIALACKTRSPQDPNFCKTRGSEYVVDYPNRGISLGISIDVAVVEIQATPLSRETWKEISELIQKDIFDLGETVGLKPQRSKGGGHLHLDLQSHFGENPQLFMDFVVDFQNHPGLSMCALGENFVANPPLAIQTRKQRDNLRALAEKVASSDNTSRMTVGEVADALVSDVFNKTLTTRKPRKYQALNTSNDFGRGTIEVRSLRPEEDAAHVEKLMHLFEARIEFLREHPQQIYQGYSYPDSPTIVKSSTIMTDRSPFKSLLARQDFKQKCVDDFYHYVEGANLSWESYRNLLLPEYRNIHPTALACSPQIDLSPVLPAGLQGLGYLPSLELLQKN